ncbi:MAG TPA: NAD(P)H-hydrate dehydratase [Candidatus Cloacimonadota bacterium]|nr:NAD(P)H-hydrate dehydratase [Candidatus Cloacimonadota bacterium]HQL15626.1 NAD(P)H-hydrate dehydratase [Candidatus Cloacimonadota bacterium]
MNFVATSDQMRRVERVTMEEIGISSRILMENAGRSCAEMLDCRFKDVMYLGVAILCGTGNNGGDGYVLARWLDYFCYDVTIITTGEGKISLDNLVNKQICEKLNIDIINWDDPNSRRAAKEELENVGVIIDAIYGTGFKGKITGPTAELIKEVNGLDKIKVALDIPSGVNADTGEAELAFIAHITFAMEALKPGHLLGKGRAYSGILRTLQIGIPSMLLEIEGAAYLLDEKNAVFPERYKFSHKGDYGRVAIFAGSPGMTGAAFMAAQAALKVGAGLVTIFCHPDNMLFYANKPYEVMIKPVPLSGKDTIDAEALSKELEKFDVLLVGPGCGISDYTHNLLSYLVSEWNKPGVIDADGLNTLALHPELVKQLGNKQMILTPHWGEFCRLAQTEMSALQKDCLKVLKNYVETNAVKVLLKSSTSVYCDGDYMFFNAKGNDGLATGGSGDVLAGMITGFLAQKLSPEQAAGTAAYYLGATAEKLADKQETFSITPTDLLDNMFLYYEEEESEPNGDLF